MNSISRTHRKCVPLRNLVHTLHSILLCDVFGVYNTRVKKILCNVPSSTCKIFVVDKSRKVGQRTIGNHCRKRERERKNSYRCTHINQYRRLVCTEHAIYGLYCLQGAKTFCHYIYELNLLTVCECPLRLNEVIFFSRSARTKKVYGSLNGYLDNIYTHCVDQQYRAYRNCVPA